MAAMTDPFLRPVLLDAATRPGPDGEDRLQQALAADPALAGRATSDPRGCVILTGPANGPPPPSAKERRRWELHVRFRLAAEFGEAAAALVPIHWDDSRKCI